MICFTYSTSSSVKGWALLYLFLGGEVNRLEEEEDEEDEEDEEEEDEEEEDEEEEDEEEDGRME